jgi:cobalt-precorrin-5B (C1)-methyltransferase
MAGKLAKLGAGVLMTHWTRSKVDPGLLACLTAEAGGTPDLVEAVGRANTARHAYELWAAAGLVRDPSAPTGPGGSGGAQFAPPANHLPCDLLCQQVAANLARFVDGRLAIEVVMVDFEGLGPVGRGAA